jgi:hypothetical protein
VVQQNGEPLADGVIFLTMADTGLFGFNGLIEQDTSNLRTQTFRNETVVTLWTGDGAAASSGGAAHGYGTVSILDSHYDTLYTVCPSAAKLNINFPPGGNFSCVADVHESYITDNDTMLVTIYNISREDLTSVGGPADGYWLNPMAAEVDIETSEIIWLLDPRDHIPVTDSKQALQGSGYNTSNPYDWFHMNSKQSWNGGYLINSRQTWSTYFVNKQGDIEWELNGESVGDFGSLPSGYNFVGRCSITKRATFLRGLTPCSHGSMTLVSTYMETISSSTPASTISTGCH